MFMKEKMENENDVSIGCKNAYVLSSNVKTHTYVMGIEMNAWNKFNPNYWWHFDDCLTQID